LKPAVDERSTLKRLKILPVLFRKQDVEKVTPQAAIFLSRAVKKGLLHRLNRGNYVNSFLRGFPRVEEVACFMRPPAYVTGEWALNYHGISVQSPIVCTAATPWAQPWAGTTGLSIRASPSSFRRSRLLFSSGSPESIISTWRRRKKPSWIRSI
jgi:hypothetical protein